ncbi:MAG: YggT family protein [Succinivibrionaceae bacterium]|nr:YggT family protein [Succinivibrionaceae bacterium]
MYGLPMSVIVFGYAANIVMTFFMLRVWFQACGVNPRNPIANFVMRLAKTPVELLGNRTMNGINLSAIGWILIVLVIKYLGIYLMLDIPSDELAHPIYIAKPALFLLRYTGCVFFFTMIIDAILSWFGANTLSEVTRCLMYPVISTMRKVIPPIGMIDISFIILMILLTVADSLVFKTLAYAVPNGAVFLWTLVI